MGELIISSRDLEKLSVRKLDKEYKSTHETQYSFNGKEYIPSKEFTRNKKAFVIQEEKLNKAKGTPIARQKTKIAVNRFMKSLELEIFGK